MGSRSFMACRKLFASLCAGRIHGHPLGRTASATFCGIVEYFDSEESLANWTIRDSAGNIVEDASGYMQWQDSRGVGETPYLHYQSLYSGKQAYLVSAPMDIAMGKAYLSLFITVGFQGNGQILYGSSSNPQEMEIKKSLMKI